MGRTKSAAEIATKAMLVDAANTIRSIFRGLDVENRGILKELLNLAIKNKNRVTNLLSNSNLSLREHEVISLIYQSTHGSYSRYSFSKLLLDRLSNIYKDIFLRNDIYVIQGSNLELNDALMRNKISSRRQFPSFVVGCTFVALDCDVVVSSKMTPFVALHLSDLQRDDVKVDGIVIDGEDGQKALAMRLIIPSIDEGLGISVFYSKCLYSIMLDHIYHRIDFLSVLTERGIFLPDIITSGSDIFGFPIYLHVNSIIEYGDYLLINYRKKVNSDRDYWAVPFGESVDSDRDVNSDGSGDLDHILYRLLREEVGVDPFDVDREDRFIISDKVGFNGFLFSLTNLCLSPLYTIRFFVKSGVDNIDSTLMRLKSRRKDYGEIGDIRSIPNSASTLAEIAVTGRFMDFHFTDFSRCAVSLYGIHKFGSEYIKYHICYIEEGRSVVDRC